jgi:enamine deaminase RidA (YjgF/YER057c/UK114 family)
MSKAKLRFVNPPEISKPNGYSHVAEAIGGRMVFVAGQVPLDADGNLVGPGDLAAQAHQVFRNIKAALAAMDADFDSVVKLNYYLMDASQLPVVREVRNQYINTAQPPVSTAVQVGGLFRPDILIEIEAVAVLAA